MDAPIEIPIDDSGTATGNSDNSLWKIIILFLVLFILILICALALGWIYEIPKWVAAYHYERAINYYSNSVSTSNPQSNPSNYCSALNEAREAVNWFGLVVVHVNSDKHPEYPSFVLLLLAVNWHDFPNTVCNAMGPIEYKQDFQSYYKTAHEWAGFQSVTRVLCELPRHPKEPNDHQKYLKEKLQEAVQVDYLPETCSIIVNPPPTPKPVPSVPVGPTQTPTPSATIAPITNIPGGTTNEPTYTPTNTAPTGTGNPSSTPQILVVTATPTNTPEPSPTLLPAPSIMVVRGQITFNECRTTVVNWGWIRRLEGEERFSLRVQREHPTLQFETRAGGDYTEPSEGQPREFRLTDEGIQGSFWLFGYVSLDGRPISYESNRIFVVCGNGNGLYMR